MDLTQSKGRAVAVQPTLFVPRPILEETERLLAVSSERKTEMVLLWSGRPRPGEIAVARVWLPRQVVSRGFFLIPSDELFELNRDLHAIGHVLVAQLHTHPTLAFHSETDDRYAVTSSEGGLSVVVPHFGLVSPAEVEQCAYFCFRGGKWCRLSPISAREAVRFA